MSREENFRKILEVVAKEPDGIQLADLAERVNRYKSIVYYQVQEMERLGMIRVRRGRRFMLIYPLPEAKA